MKRARKAAPNRGRFDAAPGERGCVMQAPIEIAFQHCKPSEEIRAEVAKQAKRLEKFSDRITSCHVAIAGPQTRHRQGDLFKIDVRIAMPEHHDVMVTKNSRRRARARASSGRGSSGVRRGGAADRGHRARYARPSQGSPAEELRRGTKPLAREEVWIRRNGGGGSRAAFFAGKPRRSGRRRRAAFHFSGVRYEQAGASP